MSYPPPSGGWHDPSAPGPQSVPPADPTMPMGGNPIPTQPTPPDPYAADPYAGMQPPGAAYAAPGYPAPGDPYAAAGYPPAYPAYGPPAYGPAAYGPAARTNGLAIAALVLSLVGFTSCITAPIGAILGHVARKQILQNGEQGEGMAKAAIIVGWILTGLMLLLIAGYAVAIIYAINTDTSSY